MADSKSRERLSAGPSNQDSYKELDLDKALAKLEVARNKPEEDEDIVDAIEVELESEVEPEENNHPDDEPDEDEFEDEDESDEANTPDIHEDEIETELLESVEAQQKPKKASQGQLDEDDPSNLSRKKRGKLIEDLRRQLQKEQDEKEKLKEQARILEEEDKRLSTDVNKALGSEEDFEKAMEDALGGDEVAQERVRIWRNNREFFKKLQKKAERDYANQFMNFGWQQVHQLEGITPEMLAKSDLSSVLKEMYEKGFEIAQDKHDNTVERLQKEVDTWKARYKALKPKSGAGRRNPVTTGGASVEDQPIEDWRRKYRDPKTGLLTDEAEAIVQQYGFEALISGKYKKKG